MTIQEQIKQRIDKAEPGMVFFVNDFAEFDNEYVSKILSIMEDFNVLERLAKGMSIWQDKTEEERIAIIQKTGVNTKIEDLAIEKDWWVTITLKALFSTSFSSFLLLKGGTSLSKGK